MNLQPELALLLALAEAYAVPHPNTQSREPIMYIPFLGGADLQHHALTPEGLEWDEEMLTRLDEQGLIRFEYGSGGQVRSISTTPQGERVAAELERANDDSEPD